MTPSEIRGTPAMSGMWVYRVRRVCRVFRLSKYGGYVGVAVHHNFQIPRYIGYAVCPDSRNIRAFRAS